MFSDVYYISSTHCDEKIAFLAIGEEIVLNFVKCREVFTRCSKLLDAFLQILGRDTQSICFSGCINISNYYVIGQTESLGKFRKQSLGTCVCMRLEYTP